MIKPLSFEMLSSGFLKIPVSGLEFLTPPGYTDPAKVLGFVLGPHQNIKGEIM